MRICDKKSKTQRLGGGGDKSCHQSDHRSVVLQDERPNRVICRLESMTVGLSGAINQTFCTRKLSSCASSEVPNQQGHSHTYCICRVNANLNNPVNSSSESCEVGLTITSKGTSGLISSVKTATPSKAVITIIAPMIMIESTNFTSRLRYLNVGSGS